VRRLSGCCLSLYSGYFPPPLAAKALERASVLSVCFYYFPAFSDGGKAALRGGNLPGVPH